MSFTLIIFSLVVKVDSCSLGITRLKLNGTSLGKLGLNLHQEDDALWDTFLFTLKARSQSKTAGKSFCK